MRRAFLLQIACVFLGLAGVLRCEWHEHLGFAQCIYLGWVRVQHVEQASDAVYADKRHLYNIYRRMGRLEEPEVWLLTQKGCYTIIESKVVVFEIACPSGRLVEA